MATNAMNVSEDPGLMYLCIIEMDPLYKPCDTDPMFIQKHKPHVLIERIQLKHLNDRLKDIQALGNGTNKNAVMRDEFPSPNAINLINRLKEKLKGTPYKFVGGYGVVIGPGGSVEELIEIVKEVHEERLDYAN